MNKLYASITFHTQFDISHWLKVIIQDIKLFQDKHISVSKVKSNKNMEDTKFNRTNLLESLKRSLSSLRLKNAFFKKIIQTHFNLVKSYDRVCRFQKTNSSSKFNHLAILQKTRSHNYMQHHKKQWVLLILYTEESNCLHSR